MSIVDKYNFERIVVVGLGYIGLPTAALIASKNRKVIGVDVDQQVVASVNKGKVHIKETDLDNLVADVVETGNLTASKTMTNGDVFIVAVPTPFIDDTQHKPDLTYLKAAFTDISAVIKKGDLIIIESTSPVGTTQEMYNYVAKLRPDLGLADFKSETNSVHFAYCPERVLPGNTLIELQTNSRIIGGNSKKASDLATIFYNDFVTGELLTVSSPELAELSKLTENAYRDVNIAFANELSLLCDEYHLNVSELIRSANKHPRVDILSPGVGVGGHCIAVDPWFIVSDKPYHSKLIKTARSVNDNKPNWVVDKTKEHIRAYCVANNVKLSHLKIACYGLSYKPNIDDLRESPALKVQIVLSQWFPGEMFICEPNIRELPSDLSNRTLCNVTEALESAELHFIFVDHDEFKNFEKLGINLISY